jgi:hypothetical protein
VTATTPDGKGELAGVSQRDAPDIRRLGTWSKEARQLQPQPSGVHPQKPPEDEEASADLEPFDDFPALNTESCRVWRLLAHLGQEIFWLDDITTRS